MAIQPDVHATPKSLRRAARDNTFTAPTSGHCPGFVQANVLILPGKYAEDFRLLCVRNPVPCPLLAVGKPGDVGFDAAVADGADITTDVPGYNVYIDGKLVEKDLKSVSHLWTDDSVAFLTGCSFTFEEALINAHLTPRHIERGTNVPMYRSNIPLMPAGVFSGVQVVSMRPYKVSQIETVRDVTRPYVRTHGEPIAWGWDAAKRLGIADIHAPEFGDAPVILDDEVPVFWGCGVTTQMAVMESPLVHGTVLAHAPGKMFCMDMKVGDIVEDIVS